MISGVVLVRKINQFDGFVQGEWSDLVRPIIEQIVAGYRADSFQVYRYRTGMLYVQCTCDQSRIFLQNFSVSGESLAVCM
jgi:hypothetical protein